MVDELTGDFDVAAELGVPGANWFLAAMHQAEPLLHSVPAWADDNLPHGLRIPKPTPVGAVERFVDSVIRQIFPPNIELPPSPEGISRAGPRA